MHQRFCLLIDDPQGLLCACPLDIGDLPVLHAVFPTGEEPGDQRAVFGLVEGDNARRVLQALLAELERRAQIARQGDAQARQFIPDVKGQQPDVVGIALDGQAARGGALLQPVFLRQVVEKRFGKAAAVVIAGADE